MEETTSRRKFTRQFGLATIGAIAFSKVGTVTGREGTNPESERDRSREKDDVALEQVYEAYDVSDSEIAFARGELTHFLDDTILHEETVITAPDRSYIEDDEYDSFLTTSEQRRIVERARRSFRLRYGVDPRNPRLLRLGNNYIPKEFLEDLYLELTTSNSESVPPEIDIEEVTGYSREELRARAEEHEGNGSTDCNCVYNEEVKDGKFGVTSSGETRPPGVSETTPTVKDGEIVLYVYLPDNDSSHYPDSDVISDSDEAFNRFSDDELDIYGPETSTVYIHSTWEPSTSDSSDLLDEFSEMAYEDAQDGVFAPDQKNTLSTLWVDEMEIRGRARFPGFYSVNATSCSRWWVPSANWSNTTLLQHEVGHNFGCYLSSDVGHDEDRAHHKNYSTTSCVMHYVSQLGTSSFCGDCELTINQSVFGLN